MLNTSHVRCISHIFRQIPFPTSACSTIGGGIISREERMWNNERNTEWNVCFWVPADCHRLFRLIQPHPTFVFSAVTIPSASPPSLPRETVWVFLYWACGTPGPVATRPRAEACDAWACTQDLTRIRAGVVSTHERARVYRRTNVKGA